MMKAISLNVQAHIWYAQCISSEPWDEHGSLRLIVTSIVPKSKKQSESIGLSWANLYTGGVIRNTTSLHCHSVSSSCLEDMVNTGIR